MQANARRFSLAAAGKLPLLRISHKQSVNVARTHIYSGGCEDWRECQTCRRRSMAKRAPSFALRALSVTNCRAFANATPGKQCKQILHSCN